MLHGLSVTGFEGMFMIPYEPFNYDVRLSAASKSIGESSRMLSRIKASILVSFPRVRSRFLGLSSKSLYGYWEAYHSRSIRIL